MKGIGTVMKAGAVLFMLLLAMVPAWAADNPEGYYQKHEHSFKQDVEGTGYAMVYQKVNTETLQLQNYLHGSGSMDAATLINSSQKSGFYYPCVDRDKGRYGHAVYPHKGIISFVEQNEMTYAPQSFAYGTGYYEQNPVVYNSKLKEKTCGKSYQEGVSMHHQIEYAEGFKKDIEVNLDCNESTDKYKGSGLAQMDIDEDVTEGAVHVGEFLTDDNGSKGVKNSLIEIDENYIGSFAIQKKMKISTTKSKKSGPRKDWLSCCFGGYSGMSDDDKTWGEEGVFNCNCYDEALSGYDPTWGGNYKYGNQTEQFPRENK
ncbi:MAG: hypothetical protein ACXQT4_05345 [Methanotrichaceae archaeon]